MTETTKPEPMTEQRREQAEKEVVMEEKTDVPGQMCKHTDSFGHPADHDIRTCPECNMRSVDHGRTWICFEEYKEKYCREESQAQSSLSIPAESAKALSVEAQFPDGKIMEEKTDVPRCISVQTSTDVDKCEVPPEGWVCSRDKGHDGPCAAIPQNTHSFQTINGGNRGANDPAECEWPDCGCEETKLDSDTLSAMSDDILLDNLLWAYETEGMPHYDVFRREVEKRMRKEPRVLTVAEVDRIGAEAAKTNPVNRKPLRDA